MAKAISNAQWTVMDVAELPQVQREAYEAYKDAYKAMKEARNAFETKFATLVPVDPGMRVIFGYNFGKLSVAIVADDRKPAAKTGTASLADWIASQRASGRGV